MEEYSQYNKGLLLRNRYQKVTDLSEGSYGLVTLAKDTKSGNFVAVKYIYPLDYNKNSRPSSSPAKMRHAEKDEDKSKRNTKEILKSLYEEAAKEILIHQILGEHCNIAALYDHFESYLVLEYCSRGDLYEVIQQGQGPASPKDIRDVFNQILDALEYCHSHQVYHRDLKPENILISEDWSIKLCDWGLATTTLKVTDKSEFDIGSERYMAPELFDPDLEYYDASKIDLWSIGIILLTIVFRKNPFEVANYSDKKFVQFARNRESLFDIFLTMTGDLFSVMRYCLNIDPTNRDLASIRSELEILNYFTIDDEFCSSDFDEYSDEEVRYEQQEYTSVVEYVTGPELAFEKPVIVEPDDEGDSTFYLETEGDRSESTINKTDMLDTSSPEPQAAQDVPYYEIPHNDRADALLSNSTSLKPIPISDYNNGRSKFFRNSRKPMSVASYQAASLQSFHNSYQPRQRNKFNREDFFTPRSVFNHYMNKYGDNKGPKNNQERPKLKKRLSNWKQNNNKPKTWKKNYRNSYKNRPRKNNHYRNKSDYKDAKSDQDTASSTPVQPRRKSNSFSMSKARAINSASQYGTPHQLGTSQQLGSSLHSQHASTSAQSNPSDKYMPPFLRSPNYRQSPVIQPLNEHVDEFQLNGDYEEVFHLEDDFELSEPSKEKPEKGRRYQAPTYNIPTDRPGFDKSGFGEFKRNSGMDFRDFRDFNRDFKDFNRDFNRLQFNGRPQSMTEAPVLASSASGKYIPPYRRGSQASEHKEKRKQKHENIHDNIDDLKDNFSNIKLNPHQISSVPNSTVGWYDDKWD